MAEELKLNEMQEKRAKILADQRKILEKAEEEKRELTADEDTNYNNLDTEYDDLTDKINKKIEDINKKKAKEEREYKLKERESYLKESQGRYTETKIDESGNKDKRDESNFVEYRIADRFKKVIKLFRSNKNCINRSTVEYLDAYKRYLVSGGINNIPYEQRDILHKVDSEYRALQSDLDTVGGYLVAPEQFVMKVIEELDNIVFMRQYATIFQVPNASSLGAPSRDNDIGDLTWTAEIGTGNEDSSLDFGKRELVPYPLARRIKVSKTLIRKAFINIVTYVAGRLAYKKGAVEENAFMNGNGVNQPLGVFTCSDHGITASRDVSTGNTTTSMKADGLIECKYTLKKQYRQMPSTRWIFHRDGVKQIRKLKDGEGQYLWKQGLSDKPDTILELPFEESEYAPHTFTTGKYVGILGDLRQYWIADSLGMEIQTLSELYAETNQMGYICRSETDGMPVLAEAFVRVKLA